MIFNIIILFAAFSALNLSIYFVVRALQSKQSLYFSLASLVLSFSLLIYALEVSHLILDYPHFIWIHAPLLYVIGPLYFFSASAKARKFWWIHLMPAVVMLVWITPFYFQTAHQKLESFTSVHSQSENLQLLSYLYLFHIGIYALLSARNFKEKIAKLSKLVLKRSFWLKFQLTKYIGLFCLLSFFACFILDYNQLYTLEVKKYTLVLIVLLLSASQLFLSFTIYGENNKKINAAFTREKKNDIHHDLKTSFRYKIMEEKFYLSAELTLETLAEKLGCSKHELSAFINQEYQRSFRHLLNHFRIQEFKNRIVDKDSRKYTILAIAKECGFSSNSSFHRAFKKEEGKTPKQYLKEMELGQK